nr:ultraviolet-B receptor UVR8 [Ipomoea batatas]
MMLHSLKRRRIPPSGILIGLTRRWICTDGGTTVMSFGDGSHGALGLPMSIPGLGSDAYEPTPVPGLPRDVTGIAAGHFHSLAVTRDRISPRETWNEPKRVEGLEKVRVRAAFASGVVSAALGEDGSLWVWGSSKRGQLGLGEGITETVVPTRVETLLGEYIVKVSLGWGHALAMTRSGRLFGWGYYADGRIGKIGKELEISPLESNSSEFKSVEAAEQSVLEAMEKEKDMPTIWNPGLVEELQGLKVEDVACGLDHSLVVCSDGTLLSGGSNAYGQLGRTNQDLGMHPVDIGSRTLNIAQGPGNIPQQVKGLDGEIPKLVSAGRAHSLVLTTKNEVWAWGCGKNGRLGLCSSADESEPMLVDFSQGFEAWEAMAGLDHSLVLGKIIC